MRDDPPARQIVDDERLQVHVEAAAEPAAAQADVREHDVAPAADQLERLVPDVFDHPLEAREVAPRAVVPAVGVRLRGQLGRDLDHDVLVRALQDRLHAALGVVVEEPPDDVDVRIGHRRKIRLG